MPKSESFSPAAFIQKTAREIVAKKEADPIAAFLKVTKGELWDADKDEEALAVDDELLRMGARRALAVAALEASRGKTGPRVHQHEAPEASPILQRKGAYNWELPNGTPLSLATIADIDEAIAKHKVKALAHAGWVKFYAAVKAKMLAAKVHSVGELFSEPELLKLSVEQGAGAVSEHPTTIVASANNHKQEGP